MRCDMVLSYVRDLLAEMTGRRPEPDHDGDLVISYGGATFHARIINPDDPVLQVFSVAVDDLPATPELFAAVNDINLNIAFARAFWVRDQLLIESEIWATDVNPANFQHAFGNIASATDVHVPDIVAAFGGKPRFDQSKEPGYGQPSLFRADGNGAYL